MDRLTNLIAIFENPALDFSKNRADGDDILGDAYEYLMKHFATESGKSKGQFYTPSEVSRIMAQLLGIRHVHEMAHLLEPTHGPRFISLMDRIMPHWRDTSELLNRLPARHERWNY